MFVVKRNPKLPENVNIINVRLKERYPVYLSFFAHVMSFHQKSALYGIFIAGTGYIVKKSFGQSVRKVFVTRCVSMIIGILLTIIRAVGVHAEENAPLEQSKEDEAVSVQAPCAVLMETSTGEILYEKAADEQRTPASVTKLMTLLLIYEEMEKNNLHLEEIVTVSAHAKSMGGSQVFLEEGEQQTVETLIKCIVIASGNDASVAMAEHIAGSEEAFVQRMNQRAAELSLAHTHFVDCCGLTDDENHYMCARDIAVVSRELAQRFPELFEYSTIWMEDIVHRTARGESTFTLTNTNKMLRSFNGCLGLKTGSTSRAGFCVSEVASRNDLMLIAVILGGETSKSRFADAATLLNYGFGICKVYTDPADQILCPEIKGSRGNEYYAAPAANFVWLDTKNRDFGKIEKTTVFMDNLSAPMKKGTCVGKHTYTYEGTVIGENQLLLTDDVLKKTWKDCIDDAMHRLFFRTEASASYY